MAATPGTGRRRTRRPGEGELTAEVHQELETGRKQMARGEYATHEEIMAK